MTGMLIIGNLNNKIKRKNTQNFVNFFLLDFDEIIKIFTSFFNARKISLKELTQAFDKFG